MTNFNTSPYFDDFDPLKNFYRVLFKPGYAVQARELNQLQSILQHQVSSIGNHVFKKNSMVIPGGISLLNGADIVSIVGVQDPTTLIGQTITNAQSFDPNDATTLLGYITAVVLGARMPTETAPGALYVKYVQTQPETSQTAARNTFNKSEELRTVGQQLIIFAVDADIGSTKGKVATISEGTFYTKELFVDCSTQSLIVETDNNVTTNCTIGLRVTESIVTSDDDLTLLDNANGSPNEFAPGADRYKVELRLARVDGEQTIDEENFINMMVIKNNSIVYVNDRTQYGELMKTLARRTYDANGNFIVRGLDTSVTESSSDDSVWINITGGKCYLGGYEYDQLTTTPIAITKPRSEQYQEQVPQISTYSFEFPFFYVGGNTLAKEVPERDSLIQFLDAAPGTSGAKVIGYGIFKHLQSAGIGSIASGTDVYKAFVESISLTSGYAFDDIGGIKATSTVDLSQGMPVLHQLNNTNVVGVFAKNNVISSTTGGTNTARVYSVFGSTLYVLKHTLNDVPSSGTITNSTGTATALVQTRFITSYRDEFVPLVEVDKEIYKSLYTYNSVVDEFQNTTSYSVTNRTIFTNLSAGETFSPTLSDPNDEYDNFSQSNYFGFITTPGSEQIVDLSSFLTVEGSRYKLTIPVGNSLVGKTLLVIGTVIKSRVAESVKTPTVTTYVVPTPSASWTALGHQDVIEILKVVEGQTVAITNAVRNVDQRVTFTVRSNNAIPILAGDIIVIKGVASQNNTGATFNTGYNKQVTVRTGTITNTTVNVGGVVFNQTTFTSDELFASDPGTYIDSAGVAALAPNINTDVDVTSRFTLFSGSTPAMTGTGMIKLRKRDVIPAGQIAVQYKYYSVGVGNYVSVDSYGSYSGNLGYIGQIPPAIRSDGTIVDVGRYIDFRTRPSHYFFKNIGSIASGSSALAVRDLNLSGRCNCLLGKYLVGPSHPTGVAITSVTFDPTTGNSIINLASPAGADASGIYFIGLNTTSLSLIDLNADARSFVLPKDNTRIRYQYVKFKPKQVMVFLKRDVDVISIDYEEVSNIRDMYALSRNEFKLPLAHAFFKPYTVTLQDITLTKFENPVYQMIDIHGIKQRLDRNDYYTSLALNRDIDEDIQDYTNELSAGGTTRGFWNENFSRPLLQDFEDSDFSCTIYDKSYVAPGTVTRTVELDIDRTLNDSSWRTTGTAITLPYTEVRAFGNTLASKSNNLNPFNVVNWVGKMVLNPSVDNWVDVTSKPAATVNNTAQINVDQVIQPEVFTKITIPTPPSVPVNPPPIVPAPPVEEIVTAINNLRTLWGPDSLGGRHAITFDWVTNTGRRGRVNTDTHVSPVVRTRGANGVFARSLINRRYNDADVKEYLNAGSPFDQQPPSAWR